MKLGVQHAETVKRSARVGEPYPGNPSNSIEELEAYLAKLENPLLGLVSKQDRYLFIEQTRMHLEQGIRDRIEKGDSSEEAARAVFADFGNPRRNADEFLESWFQYQIKTPLYRFFGHANLIAYGVFQAAAVIYYLILQLNVFLPSEATYHLPWRVSPIQIRRVWPEPLPFPDFTPNFFLTVGWPVLSPIIAGVIVGFLVPSRASAAVYRGLMPLIMLSFVIGTLLLPVTAGLVFALFQVTFWLPVGCASAKIASIVARRRRYRRVSRLLSSFETGENR